MGRAVPAVEGIGSGKDGGTCVERGGDACFGDGDCLLFHDFMDGSSVVLVHLIELVDAAHSHIGQHQRTCLQTDVLGH